MVSSFIQLVYGFAQTIWKNSLILDPQTTHYIYVIYSFLWWFLFVFRMVIIVIIRHNLYCIQICPPIHVDIKNIIADVKTNWCRVLFSNIEILPGQPQNVEVEGLSDSSIKVSWGPPLSNADSITEYVVNVTMLRTFDDNTMDTTTDSQNSSQSIVTPHSVQITVKVLFKYYN